VDIGEAERCAFRIRNAERSTSGRCSSSISRAGLIWAYVMRSLSHMRSRAVLDWFGIRAAAGGALATLRLFVDSLMPLLAGGTVLNFRACLAAMGIRRFMTNRMVARTALITD